MAANAKTEQQSPKVSLQASAMAQAREKASLLDEAPDAELAGIRRSLQEVEMVSAKMVDNGLSQQSFFFGVVNIALTGFVLGRWPQHLWVLYIVKVFVLIPAWWCEVKRKYNAGLWVLDYCWVQNLSMGLYMLANLVAGPHIPAVVQRWAFLWFFSTALGPLSWAVLALGNGLVFHSVERTASLFIHMTPCIVAWTLRWSRPAVIAAWPDHFSYFTLEDAHTGEVYIAGISVYVCWLVLHATWLLSCGVDAPSKGYSTVFDGLYQKHKLGEKFQKRTGLKSVRAHAAIYLALHALACTICFTWSMLCYKFWVVHTAFGIVLFTSGVWVGSGYYIHIFKNGYKKALEKLLPKQEVA